MTIYALSTGPGVSGIAIIRISGSDSSKAITLLTGKPIPLPRVACLRKINNINTSELIDQGIIIWFPGPESYTGEDMAEIHVHGGKAVVLTLQNELSKIENFRLAEPGEFTKIAFQNGKINLLKAESIADLISAETEIQRQQAIKIMSGASSDKFNSWREGLLKILSNVEAKIDFSDEDLPKNITRDIIEQKENIIKKIEEIIKLSNKNRSLMSGFVISVIGRPNTGKSSFVNYVSGRDVSIVTKIPGTTRDPIESEVDIGGYHLVFIDTAGIRRHKNKIEKIGIEKSFEKSKNSDLNLVFLEKNEIKEYENIEKKIFVKSKYDIRKQGKSKNIYRISSKTGYGIATLLRVIQRKFALNNKNELPIISRERQLAKVKKCLKHLKSFNLEKNIDMAAADIRSALKEINEIYHKFDIEEILDIIFNDFCIGK